MFLVYATRTQNIQRIIDKLQLKNVLKIEENNIKKISQPFWLLTYTDMLGSIPLEVEKFLEKNHKNLKGVAGSGNRNFGNNFCGAAKKIHEKYKVPLIATFELMGNDEAINLFKQNFYNCGGR